MSGNSTAPNWVIFLHLSLLSGWLVPVPFIGIIAPLIIWQTGKAQQPHFDQHGRNAMNWVISSTLYSLVLPLTVIGIALLPILAGLGIIFPIIAAIQASKGQVWKYPLTLNILGANPERFLSRAAIALLSLCIFPLAVLLGSTYWANRRRSWLATLSAMQGTVTQVLEKTEEDGDILYQPVIKFKTASGESYQLSTLWWSDSPSHQVGESVEVLYPPANPDQAILNGWSEKWLMTTLALVLSTVLLVFSMIPSLICLGLSRLA
ncbi:MAG: DUF4870 domain-containing protein [Elainellaceae cyanobacterium]